MEQNATSNKCASTQLISIHRCTHLQMQRPEVGINFIPLYRKAYRHPHSISNYHCTHYSLLLQALCNLYNKAKTIRCASDPRLLEVDGEPCPCAATMPATPQRRWLLLRCRAASSTPLPPASTGHPSPTTAEFQSAPHLPQKPTPCPHAAGKRNWRRHATHLIEAPERASPSRLLARRAGDDGGAGVGGRGRR